MPQPVNFIFPDGPAQIPAYVHLYRTDESERYAVMAQTRSKNWQVGTSSYVSGMRGNAYPYTFEVKETPDEETYVELTVRDSTNRVAVIEDKGTTKLKDGVVEIHDDATVEIQGPAPFEIELLIP